MAVVLNEQRIDSGRPEIYAYVEYIWSGNTLTVYIRYRTGSGGGWANDPWSAAVTVNGDRQLKQIKGNTTGMILGTTWYPNSTGQTYTFSVSGSSVSVRLELGGFNSRIGSTTFPFEKYVVYDNYFTAYSPWSMPSQTFVTISANGTSGNTSSSGDQSYTSRTWTNSSSTCYAGDSFTYTWDKNNEASVGASANPTSEAHLCRTSSSSYDSSYSNLYTAWSETGGSGDLYETYSRSASTSDMGYYLQARIWKYYSDANGNRYSNIQSNGHYIEDEPSIRANCSLRSTRFYSGTPSCVVWKVNTYNTYNNGYGVHCSTSSSGDKFRVTTDDTTSRPYIGVGSGSWSSNYSFSGYYDVHTNKTTISSRSGSAKAYSNYYNPRNDKNLGELYSTIGSISTVSGSVDLPTINSIAPISGSGTTMVVNTTKRVYTNQTSPTIQYRVNHSGNSHGFGYDLREDSRSGTSSSSISYYNCSGMPAPITGWDLDRTSDMFNATVSGVRTSGATTSWTIVPYITDSSGYKIFGEKTRSYVQTDDYTFYLIDKPKAPTLDTLENTLPAIDGVRDVVKWTATSPSSFGNVLDFPYGYKLRYQIGSDSPRYSGYEWKFISSPTTTNTKFSGSITETYDRSMNTTCNASIAATSYYSDVWDAYLDFQSAFSSPVSYPIAAKDPYKGTTGTITSLEPVTVQLNAPFKYTCETGTMNGNTLIQTATLIVDGQEMNQINVPTYTTSTPNKLTGELTVTFGEARDATPILAVGLHNLQVKNQIVTYFNSSTPTQNHVYFGETTVYTNEIEIEVVEIPAIPTIDPTTQAYHYAGQERTFTFHFSPNYWGCTDRDHNNRHFEYEFVGPSDTSRKEGVLAKGELGKLEDTWSYTFTPTSPVSEGVYKFKLRTATIAGHSAWVEEIVEVLSAEEPSPSEINIGKIIALDEWEWQLVIVPGENGTYLPLADPSTKVTATVILPKEHFTLGNTDSYEVIKELFTKEYKNKERLVERPISDLGDYVDNKHKLVVSYERKYTVTPNATYLDKINGCDNLYNYKDAYIVTDTDHCKVTTDEDGWITFSADATAYKVGETVINYFTGLANLVANKSYTVVTEIKEVTGIGELRVYSTGLDEENNQCRTKKDPGYYNFNDLRAGDILFNKVDVTQLEYNTKAHYSLSSYMKVWNGAGSITCRFSIIGDNDVNENTFAYKPYGAEHESMIETQVVDITLPAIALADHSHIVDCQKDWDYMPFQIDIDLFAASTEYQAWYSLDYGETWIELTDYEDTGRLKKYRLLLENTLSWTDVIYLKAHGANPEAEDTQIWTHEMPTDYLVWLKWCKEGKEDFPEDRIRRIFIAHDGDVERKARHVSKF